MMRIIILVTGALICDHVVTIDSIPSQQDDTESNTNSNWTATKILTKKRVNLRNYADTSEKIAVPHDGDFLTFIRHSSMWIDKSLLIQQLKLTNVILAPPKWGKSINLSMLKFYYELQTDDNGLPIPKNQTASYKYFIEGKVVLKNGTIEELDGIPLISAAGTIRLAQYPIIYLNGSIYDGSIESFRSMIHAAFQYHKKPYKQMMMKQNDHLKKFRKYYNKRQIDTMDYLTLQQSIENLGAILRSIYSRDVVILFDDFDYFIRCIDFDTYFNPNNEFGCNRYRYFDTDYENFFDGIISHNARYKKVVTTGVFFLRDYYVGMYPSGLLQSHVFFNDYMAPFYGIFEEEFRKMAYIRGIDGHVVDYATQWYGGYRSMERNISIYSTYSASRFISTLQIRDYWPRSRLFELLNGILRQLKYHINKSELSDYLQNNKIYHELEALSYLTTGPELLELISDEYRNPTNETYSHVCVFMWFVGYVTPHKSFKKSRYLHEQFYQCIPITIPNREIYNQLIPLTND